MRRVLASIAGGVIIPVLLVLCLLTIEGLGVTFPSWLRDAVVFMIQWPLIPLSKVMQNPWAMPGGDAPRDGVVTAWLGIHFVFFALFTYVVLWLRARRRLR